LFTGGAAFVEQLARSQGLALRGNAPTADSRAWINCLPSEREPGFDFRFIEGSASAVSPDQQHDFVTSFHSDHASLKTWAATVGWTLPAVPDLQISVSEAYRISRALVPTWEGRVGWMEFPARRVIAGNAAILHELVHVYFPNGNRLLAEGFAIYLQDLIGGNQAFPNFGRPLHEVARAVLQEIVPGFGVGDVTALDQLHLADLDGIATPNPLTLEIGGHVLGEEARGQGRLYPLAGSFVQFLIEEHGIARFRELYASTPLIPSVLNGGTPGRWRDAYGRPLTAFEIEWKSLIAGSTATKEQDHA
jgi:hypothetical protein